MSRWMTDEEICTSYRDAAYKGQQLEILAELNAVTVETITAILERGGYRVGEEAEEAKPAKKLVKVENGKEWTAEEDEKLIELHNAGMSGVDIGKEMGRTKYSVQTRLQVLRRRGVALVRNKPGRESKKEKQKTEEKTMGNATITCERGGILLLAKLTALLGHWSADGYEVEDIEISTCAESGVMSGTIDGLRFVVEVRP